MSATTEQIEALALELFHEREIAKGWSPDWLPTVDDIKRAALRNSFDAARWSACLDRAASALNPIAQGPVDESDGA